jgi:hypothetical protein
MMNLPSFERCHLTGAIRGRPSVFSRKLVLQVEVQIEEIRGCDRVRIPPPPGRAAPEWDAREEARIDAAWRPARRIWRDATWEDQLQLAELQKVAA